MPNLLAMSFEGELAPSFDLRCLHPGRTPPDGWGIGYYPGGEPSATVLKEPAPPNGSIRSELVKAWEHLESSLFVVHVRTATWGGATDANTQPFARAWGRRDWLFAHSGSLRARPSLRPHPIFEPVGSSDSEALLCELLGRLSDHGWSSLGEADPEALLRWYAGLNEQGGLTSVLTDGLDLLVYADRDPQGPPVHVWEARPPYSRLRLADHDLVVDLARRGPKSRKGVVVASEPLEIDSESDGGWRRLLPGHLLLVRQGAIRVHLAGPEPAPQLALGPAFASRPAPAHPRRAEPQRLEITHRTVYRYAQPVERSAHVFRLVPVHDRLQSVLRSEISCSVPGQVRDYEDLFGNQIRRLAVETPFSEMVIEARSLVETLDTDPLSYRPLRARTTIPLVWMPWHRQLLQPFLLPPELAESELLELADYAMSFVARNDHDLLETLLDLSSTIHREYHYVKGSTTLATTPFDVYARRRGVCQDFTNLFICLARLLGVPARYVCGYLHTGAAEPNRAQAEASHAWAQVYLPDVGWRGLDPTNGVLTQTDHVRVATGRNWRDATPTSGTIFVGGGAETLEVDVRVVRVE
ncbi:MAG TPA: class II glutamine amidotransferase [Anaeromyxobacter sp.]|nr:class II glutamine amidotransferase [Anaeromyxobacter sp.]